MPIESLRRVSSVWIVLGFALAAWLRFANATPFRAMADWQSRLLGQSFPQSTQIILTLALILPALASLVYASKRAAREAEGEDTRLAAIRSGTLRLYVVLAIATLAALAAIVALLLIMALPSNNGKAAEYDLARPVHGLASGPAILSGVHPKAGELRYASSQFASVNIARYMPVAGGADHGVPWLVIQRADDGLTFDAATLPSRFQGVLASDALPRGLVNTLQERQLLTKGPDGHYWVLFTQTANLYSPYWAAAREFVVLALVFLAVGAIQIWKLRKLGA